MLILRYFFVPPRLVLFLAATVRLAAQPVDIVLPDGAAPLERYAASELGRYLERLFGATPRITGTLSARSSRPAFRVGSSDRLPAQGILLQPDRSGTRPVFTVAGGSPRATLWAVYELAERWGAVYLTDRDVLPPRRPFRMPAFQVRMEPQFPIRAHPTIQDFACSGEAWGIADFRRLIDQLAKLKFTRVNVYPFGWQPYLDYKAGGIARRSAWLWYDYHYPVTAGMPGRSIFGAAPEFWNPDLPLKGSYEDLVRAGVQLMRSVIDHAHSRGMECVITANLTEYPPEFEPLLKSSRKIRQLGSLTVVPGPETALDDPGLLQLARTVLRATVDTYPDADLVTVYMPEWRQWTGRYSEAWKGLDARYGIGGIMSPDDALARAAVRRGYTGGVQKAQDEVKGDLADLFFYDTLIRRGDALAGSRRPGMKFLYWGVAEELFPILKAILPPGSETGAMPDNFPTHLVKRLDVLKNIPPRSIPSSMDLTLDDDNIGLVPQITDSSLALLVDEMRRDGWAGIVARERFPADHDLTLAYLARAAWDPEASPQSVARDRLRSMCGERCAGQMLFALRDIEDVTKLFERENTGFAFPVPGMLMKYWKPQPEPAYLESARGLYRRAAESAGNAGREARGEARGYFDFWSGRLEFAARYLSVVQSVIRAANANAAGARAEARTQLESAVAALRQGVEAYARVARNQSDRGAIAVVDEYGWRPLEAKIAELR